MGDVEVREDNTEEVTEGIRVAILAALEEIGLMAEGYAKRELSTPKGGHRSGQDPRPSVDTGNLRNSVTHVVDAADRSVVVGTNVEYAPYVELGTARAKEFPFLRPAATEHGDEYREVLERHLKDA